MRPAVSFTAPRPLGTTPADAALCAAVYARSWPLGAAHDYTPAEIAERLATRPLGYWLELLERSRVRLHASWEDAHGFALISPTPDGDELSYLFVEPEAFGTGLAHTLHAAALAAAPGPLRAWVLAGNARALAFYTRRGWQLGDPDAQPHWAGRQRFRLLERPDSAGARGGWRLSPPRHA